METFDFPFHLVETEYPFSTTQVQFNNSWTAAIGPTSPDQRTFKLSMTGFKYYGVAGALDLDTTPQLNMGVIEAFYNVHKQHEMFNYPHAVYGTLTCRFSKPLIIPKGIVGGNGRLEDFELKMVEIPA